QCHQTIEENPVWSRVFGYLVPQEVEPTEVVVFYKGGWVLLDDDGNINPATVEGEPLKTILTEADRGKVWRAIEPEWLHYAWLDDHWECYPCDPRRNPYLTNHWAARTNSEDLLERKAGFVEVP